MVHQGLYLNGYLGSIYSVNTDTKKSVLCLCIAGETTRERQRSQRLILTGEPWPSAWLRLATKHLKSHIFVTLLWIRGPAKRKLVWTNICLLFRQRLWAGVSPRHSSVLTWVRGRLGVTWPFTKTLCDPAEPPGKSPDNCWRCTFTQASVTPLNTCQSALHQKPCAPHQSMAGPSISPF